MISPRLALPLCALVILATRAHAAPNAPAFLDDEAEPSTNVSWEMSKPAAAQSLVFDYKDAKNFYALDFAPNKATFSRTVGGVKKILNSASVAWDAKNQVVLQRRPWLMQLVVDDKIALRGFDASFDRGKIGAAPASWGELRVQPLEPVLFDDDFTRADKKGDDLWKTTGKWQLSASSELISDKNASMSSNPFAFQVTTPKAESFATSGRWFWDSYDARVAVRPGGAGQVGVAAYVKDAKNYLAFRWSSEEGENARQIVRVTDGKTTVLASGKGAFLPKQWYKMGLRTSPGYVEAILDGVPVLRAANEDLGQGGVGLWAKDMDAAEFDDVQVRSYDFLRTSFASNGAWERATGKWVLARGVALGQSDPAAGNGADGLLVTGARDWDGYRAHISAQMKPGATVGYAVGVRDAKNYTLFQVSPDKKARIVRVTNGARKTLFEGDADLSAQTDKEGFARFQIDARNGALRVKAGDTLIAQASGPGLTGGRFALMSQSANPVAFKDAVIYFPPPPAPPTVATRMEDDAYMVGWASASGQWPPAPGPNGLEFWNTGEFFGDTTLDFPWRSTFNGKFEVALNAKRGDFDSGYLLRAVSDKEAKKIDWTLTRDGKTLTSATMPYSALPAINTPEGDLLYLQMTGKGLMLLAGETPVLSHLDAKPPRGTAVGVRSSGFRVRTEKLMATTANRDDYTFTEAPVDFYAPSGRWNVFSRWPCYGDWSFFGGTGRNPVLWSKRTYGGDVVAEFYAHPQMDLPKEPGYSHPGDLNVSLCGDGKNPASGYSFVLAGHNNTATQILRGDKVVAERKDDKGTFQDTINHNMAWHRKWFYIRAEARAATQNGKEGVMVTLTLDNEKLLDYFDADPLPLYDDGGRVAFWTLDSTMMIARAKIEAEKMGTRALPQGLMEAAYVDLDATAKGTEMTPMPVVENGVKTAIVEAGQGSWTITNPVSGGIFAVDLNRAPLTATPATKFSMNAAVTGDVKIDLYAMIDGQWRTIKLSGGQKPDPMAPTLGALSKADNLYSFDVGAALAKEFPGEKSWKIDTLRLGAMQGNPYRWIGFDGNGMDSNYRIANLNWK